jgi:hypothetical protein
VLAICVGVAVQFYNQFQFGTEEIGDEGLNCVLSAKLETAKLTIAEGDPEFFLCGGGVLAH